MSWDFALEISRIVWYLLTLAHSTLISCGYILNSSAERLANFEKTNTLDQWELVLQAREESERNLCYTPNSQRNEQQSCLLHYFFSELVKKNVITLPVPVTVTNWRDNNYSVKQTSRFLSSGAGVVLSATGNCTSCAWRHVSAVRYARFVTSRAAVV